MEPPSESFDWKSKIDYCISSDKKIVRDIKVIPGISMNADHRLIIAKV